MPPPLEVFELNMTEPRFTNYLFGVMYLLHVEDGWLLMITVLLGRRAPPTTVVRLPLPLTKEPLDWLMGFKS